jgi:hypothetical protein
MTKKSIAEMLDEYSDFLNLDLPVDWTHREHDVRNETLEEVARAIAALPFNDAFDSFAIWIRAQKSGPGGRHDL